MDQGPVLVCTEGPLHGRVFPIRGAGLRLGRAPDNDVVIADDDGVSRYHAILQLDDGKLWVRDAGSRNGVFVNEKRLAEHKELSVGDVVAIGDSAFAVRWGDEVAPAGGSTAGSQGGTERTGWRRFWPFG
jgi:pSer/pThr/pTyr-binding forkhead associated (FHA) protein